MMAFVRLAPFTSSVVVSDKKTESPCFVPLRKLVSIPYRDDDNA